MRSIAIIPAKGTSVRIPMKNRRLFHGRPMLSYSITTAKESKLFDEIIVSTDDERIVAVAKAYGAKVHMRPARLCVDNVGTQEVMKVALNWWNVCHPKRTPQYACCIYATAPLMTKSDLRVGYGMLGSRISSYVYPVGPDGKDAGAWYWGMANSFLTGVPLEGNSQHYELPAERVCDVNTEADWMRAERLYIEMKETA